MPRQKITTFLWFDHQAEEWAQFYVSVFKDARINRIVMQMTKLDIAQLKLAYEQ